MKYFITEIQKMYNNQELLFNENSMVLFYSKKRCSKLLNCETYFVKNVQTGTISDTGIFREKYF